MQREQRIHIVVLGGGYAGVVGAFDLAARLRNRAKITLVDSRDHFVQRVRLHEVAAGTVMRDPSFAELVGGTAVEFVRAQVQTIDLDRRLLQTDERAIPYDRLLVATGSTSTASVPGVREHAYMLASRARALALHQAIGEAVTKVAVVGGGITALELAFELQQAYPQLRMTMVAPDIGAGLGDHAQRVLATKLEALGISRDSRRVMEVDALGVALGRGRLEADMTIWAAGFEASSLGAQAGLAIGSQQRILVDAHLRSVSHADVFVAGDAALPPPTIGAPALMSCRLAIPMALHATTNLVADVDGETLEPWRIRDTLRCISLGRNDGLVVFMHADGRPTRWQLTGRPAALVKELIVRSTMATIRHYRRGAVRAQRHMSRRWGTAMSCGGQES